MKKSFNLNILVFLIILIVVSIVSYKLGNLNLTNNGLLPTFNNSPTQDLIWEKSVVRVHLEYPSDKFEIYEPEPNPGDRSILSNFQLLDKTNGESAVDGSFWNETKRSGIKELNLYATKNKLKEVNIGKFTNESGDGYDIASYLTLGREDGTYYYLTQGDNDDVYVLTLSVQDKYLENDAVKKVILSTRPY